MHKVRIRGVVVIMVDREYDMNNRTWEERLLESERRKQEEAEELKVNNYTLCIRKIRQCLVYCILYFLTPLSSSFLSSK